MRSLNRRLQQLETVFISRVENNNEWGSLAQFRNQLLRRATECAGQACVEQYTKELDELGPTGLWRELVRSYLGDHGFEQARSESLAETTARALGIDTAELRALMQQGQLGPALLNRFERTGIASEN